MLGIAEARNVADAVLREPVVSFLRRLHVHERNLRSCRVELAAQPRDVFERFTTKRSPEMTQEDQQQRRAIRQLADLRRNPHAAVTAVCAHFSNFRASS